MRRLIFLSLFFVLSCPSWLRAEVTLKTSTTVSILRAGNRAVTYVVDGTDQRDCPVEVRRQQRRLGPGDNALIEYQLTVKAKAEAVNFNVSTELDTDFPADDCDFLMPGFWYHRNLRSPREAPSFHTSRHWSVRDDRLSSPLSGAYNLMTGEGISVMRL